MNEDKDKYIRDVCASLDTLLATMEDGIGCVVKSDCADCDWCLLQKKTPDGKVKGKKKMWKTPKRPITGMRGYQICHFSAAVDCIRKMFEQIPGYARVNPGPSSRQTIPRGERAQIERMKYQVDTALEAMGDECFYPSPCWSCVFHTSVRGEQWLDTRRDEDGKRDGWHCSIKTIAAILRDLKEVMNR